MSCFLLLPCRLPVATLSLPCRFSVALLSHLPCRLAVACLSLPVTSLPLSCRFPVVFLLPPCRLPVATLLPSCRSLPHFAVACLVWPESNVFADMEEKNGGYQPSERIMALTKKESRTSVWPKLCDPFISWLHVSLITRDTTMTTTSADTTMMGGDEDMYFTPS